jgi:anti-anti-sigma regulatory factor
LLIGLGEVSMLRITTTERNTLKLEGRVVGPWVAELRRAVAEQCAISARVVLDLAEVTYADAEGTRLLRELRLLPADLRNPSPFVAELLGAV